MTTKTLFIKYGPILASFSFIFVLFSFQLQYYKFKKALMVCLRFKPKAAKWYARTKPPSYGGHPSKTLFNFRDSHGRTNFYTFSSYYYWEKSIREKRFTKFLLKMEWSQFSKPKFRPKNFIVRKIICLCDIRESLRRNEIGSSDTKLNDTVFEL